MYSVLQINSSGSSGSIARTTRSRRFSCASIHPAVALLRPTGIGDLTAASVKKKLKRKEFARNVRREDIDRGAKDFGVDLTEHIQFVIDAMKPHASELGLQAGAAGDDS